MVQLWLINHYHALARNYCVINKCNKSLPFLARNYYYVFFVQLDLQVCIK